MAAPHMRGKIPSGVRMSVAQGHRPGGAGALNQGGRPDVACFLSFLKL